MGSIRRPDTISVVLSPYRGCYLLLASLAAVAVAICSSSLSVNSLKQIHDGVFFADSHDA